MKLQFIKELADIMENKGLSLLEIKEDNTSIRIERSAVMLREGVSVDYKSAAEEIKPRAETRNKDEAITSPMVGVFYAAPSPDSAPYVKEGSRVKQGDVLCIIEAMKLMNEITAEKDGVITEVCIKNGDIAEFGQTLFHIKPGEENE
jgi:acetyl-CoA carboxylase biotin carboxyl carrier protein